MKSPFNAACDHLIDRSGDQIADDRENSVPPQGHQWKGEDIVSRKDPHMRSHFADSVDDIIDLRDVPGSFLDPDNRWIGQEPLKSRCVEVLSVLPWWL